MKPVDYIHIDIQKQSMLLFDENREFLRIYPISTAKNGPGENYGSFCTPRGWHQIRAKIGAELPKNAIFEKRRFTGNYYKTGDIQRFSADKDWILTRILWLSGLEPGKNRFGNVDTAKRKIYIHGTPDETLLGIPGSKGCIRMSHDDLIAVFDMVTIGLKVLIC